MLRRMFELKGKKLFVIFSRYFRGDQIKEGAVDGSCKARARCEKLIQSFVCKSEDSWC